ncbi:MAG: substrate-binding domain-containing protein [Pseudomonadota bacterium]
MATITLSLCAWGDLAGANTVTVTLQTKSGGVEVTGGLITSTSDSFVVKTPAGAVTFQPDDVTCEGMACPVARADSTQRVPEQFQRIELSSLDKQIVVKGKLRGVSDTHFTVDVPRIGLVKLQRRGLRCSGPGCRATSAIVARPQLPVQIVGSHHLTNKLLPALLTSFAKKDGVEGALQRFSSNTYAFEIGSPEKSLFVGGTGTSAAFSAFAAGAADLMIAGRQPTNAEVAALTAQGAPDPRGADTETVIANVRLAIVIHPELDMPPLRRDQLAQIFRGEISNWSELGGPSAPITRVIRDHATDESAIFARSILGGPAPSLLRGAVIAASQQEMVDLIAANRFAIGYAWSDVSDQVAELPLIGSCGIPSHDTAFALEAEDVLLGSRVYLYGHKKAREGLASALSDYMSRAYFVMDPERAFEPKRDPNRARQSVDRIIRRDLSGTEAQIAAQLAAALPRWDRLSITIRGARDGDLLDRKAQQDMRRLVSFLGTTPESTPVAIVGFTDRKDDFEQSIRQSLNAANLVMEVLKQSAGETLGKRRVLPVGYGDLVPVACDTDPLGPQLNQRVEIWLRNAQP